MLAAAPVTAAVTIPFESTEIVPFVWLWFVGFTSETLYWACPLVHGPVVNVALNEVVIALPFALITPVFVGFAFGPEVLGGLLAGVTVSGVLLGMFQNNAGGAWDNAKKSFEAGVEINGKMEYKGSEAHKASVTGDTVRFGWARKSLASV